MNIYQVEGQGFNYVQGDFFTENMSPQPVNILTHVVEPLDYIEKPHKLKVKPAQLTSGDKRLMKNQYLQRMREAKDQDEMRECTFTPSLNTKSIEIIRSKGPREPVQEKAIKI